MSEADEKPVEDEDGMEPEEGEEPGGGNKRRLNLRFLIMFVAAPLLLVMGIGGGTAWYMGWLGGAQEQQAAEAPAPAKPAFFYNLPEMLVNLSRRDKRAQYLKLQVALELSNEDIVEILEPVLPRIMDTFQVYLRELRSADLDGSAGVYRLKEELLRRVNLSIAPRRIERVLFKEIIIQ